MLPLLRSVPQRALVRLLRYLRTLMLNDSAADVNAAAGVKDCDTVPSLHRVVEWSSMCLDAVGLQVMCVLVTSRTARLPARARDSLTAGDDPGRQRNFCWTE